MLTSITTPLQEESDYDALGDLGARLRELRNEKKMTLAELSLRSQVSIGMLSHIERGQTSPSLKTLERLRLALEVPLASFFEREDPAPKNEGTVVRAHARARLPFKKLGLVKERLSPPGHSDLDVLMLVIEPGEAQELNHGLARAKKPVWCWREPLSCTWAMPVTCFEKATVSSLMAVNLIPFAIRTRPQRACCGSSSRMRRAERLSHKAR
ncbi:helix-turn-helix transcriptional regulator [Ottowia sp. VDI28]